MPSLMRCVVGAVCYGVQSVDHWAARYPTFTPDLGQVVRQWVELFHREKDAAVAAGSGADGFVTGEFGQGTAPGAQCRPSNFACTVHM